jgi:hypothetical protein
MLARYLDLNVRYCALTALRTELEDLAAAVTERDAQHAETLTLIASRVGDVAQRVDRECAALAHDLRLRFGLKTSDLFPDPAGRVEAVSRCTATALRHLDEDGSLGQFGLRLVTGWGHTTVRLVRS